MFGLFFPTVYLVKSKIWPFLKQCLAFFSHKLLATLDSVHHYPPSLHQGGHKRPMDGRGGKNLCCCLIKKFRSHFTPSAFAHSAPEDGCKQLLCKAQATAVTTSPTISYFHNDEIILYHECRLAV